MLSLTSDDGHLSDNNSRFEVKLIDGIQILNMNFVERCALCNAKYYPSNLLVVLKSYRYFTCVNSV